MSDIDENKAKQILQSLIDAYPGTGVVLTLVSQDGTQQFVESNLPKEGASFYAHESATLFDRQFFSEKQREGIETEYEPLASQIGELILKNYMQSFGTTSEEVAKDPLALVCITSAAMFFATNLLAAAIGNTLPKDSINYYVLMSRLRWVKDDMVTASLMWADKQPESRASAAFQKKRDNSPLN